MDAEPRDIHRVGNSLLRAFLPGDKRAGIQAGGGDRRLRAVVVRNVR